MVMKMAASETAVASIEEQLEQLPNPDETITHTLKYPMMNPRPLDPSELRLRPVYVGDLRAIDRDLSSSESTAILISRLSGLDIKDVDRLHVSDYQAMAGVIAARMGKEAGLAAMLLAIASRQTGETA
jgi:hypothetical protein